MINFNFTAWIPFWPGRVDLYQQTRKAGDDKQWHRYRHRTSFDWIWDTERTEECLPSKVYGKEMEGNSGVRVCLNLSLTEHMNVAPDDPPPTFNCCLTWRGSQVLIRVERSILSPWRAILWLKICPPRVRSASGGGQLPRRPGGIFDRLAAETRFWQ